MRESMNTVCEGGNEIDDKANDNIVLAKIMKCEAEGIKVAIIIIMKGNHIKVYKCNNDNEMTAGQSE